MKELSAREKEFFNLGKKDAELDKIDAGQSCIKTKKDKAAYNLGVAAYTARKEIAKNYTNAGRPPIKTKKGKGDYIPRKEIATTSTALIEVKHEL